MLDAPLSSDSHAYLAEVVSQQLSKGSQADLIATGEGFWLYNGKIWEHLDPMTVRKAVLDLDRHPVIRGQDPSSGELTYRPLKVNHGLVEGVASLLRVLHGCCNEDFFETVPAGIQFNNGFLTINPSGELILKPSSPDWRQRVLMGWDWEPKAYAPRWEEALDQWFEVNPILGGETEFDPQHDALHKRMFLQEFAGGCLMGFATEYAKAAILLGGGRNGKSKFIEAIQTAFPPGAWSSIDPQSLGDEYRAAMLAGKRINFAADIPSTKIVSSHVFKAAVTGDVITARQIRQEPFQFKPKAGHVFSANALPGTRDHSQGFWRRFVVVEFANKFEGSNLDPHLSNKLAAEKPAIVAWMIRGAQRLLKHGQYTIAASSQQHLAIWRRDSDIVALWLDERTADVEDPSEGSRREDMWLGFDVWRQANRYSSMGSRTFYRRLKTLLGDPVHKSYGRRYLKKLL